jgi:hypothetical protein
MNARADALRSVRWVAVAVEIGFPLTVPLKGSAVSKGCACYASNGLASSWG